MIITENLREQLYRDYYDKVFGYVMSRVRNYHNAQDIASTVFLKVYARLESYDPERAGISTWIYTITRNTLTDYFRGYRPAEELSENAECCDKRDAVLDELLEGLNKELARLPKQQRDIIILHYYFGLSHKEIADKMGISYANTRKQCSLAIGILRGKLTT